MRCHCMRTGCRRGCVFKKYAQQLASLQASKCAMHAAVWTATSARRAPAAASLLSGRHHALLFQSTAARSAALDLDAVALPHNAGIPGAAQAVDQSQAPSAAGQGSRQAHRRWH